MLKARGVTYYEHSNKQIKKIKNRQFFKKNVWRVGVIGLPMTNWFYCGTECYKHHYNEVWLGFLYNPVQKYMIIQWNRKPLPSKPLMIMIRKEWLYNPVQIYMIIQWNIKPLHSKHLMICQDMENFIKFTIPINQFVVIYHHILYQ